MNPDVLANLARRWRWRTLCRELCLVLGGFALVAAVWVAWSRYPTWPVVLAILAGLTLSLRLRRLQPWRIGPERVAAHLDRTHPELEESAGLWLKVPAALNLTERLQRQRLDRSWAGLRAGGVRPERPPIGFWRLPLAACILGTISLAAATAWRAAHPSRTESVQAPFAGVAPTKSPPTPTPRPATVKTVALTVVPPAYTGRPPRTVVGLDAEVEEGATVTWQVRLDGPPAQTVRLAFGEGVGEIPLRETTPGGSWEGTRIIGSASGIYHVAVGSPDGREWSPPEIGSLKVVPDLPPIVTLVQPTGPRTELDPTGTTNLPVELRVTDDYGVRGARLVATVAKGSGEAVKFRERTLEFDPSPAPETGTTPQERRFTTTLDLPALGLEPGDELYFHAEAEDNHPPTAHRVRSESHFVVLRGPAATPTTPGRGVSGVNLVPEYFRSQRQIILDTERLISERPGLSDREFRRRSDDLGADQSLLRLRYGQFVGEESEAGAGGGGDHVEVNLNPLRPGVSAGVPADLVHQHDHGGGDSAGGTVSANDPRAGLHTAMRLQFEHADQARGGGDHDAAPGTPAAGLPPTPGQILAPFVDQHDSQEKATFFDHETRATLRGVLAEMWAAERLLRTARPDDALAPEHRALDGLKELQQGERLYVQRVGFEPTPLRVAERRGKGDVGDVPERGNTPGPVLPEATAAVAKIRAALATLPGGNGRAGHLNAGERKALEVIAEPLGTAAAARGGAFLEGFRALRRLTAGGDSATAPADLAAVRLALLQLLPPIEERPERRWQTAPPLAPSGTGEAAPTGGGSGAP